MIRTPLRPLARIISARERGEDPDKGEAEVRAAAARAKRARRNRRAEMRLVLIAGLLVSAFATIGIRMAVMAVTPNKSAAAQSESDIISGDRADILDRRGRVLATNVYVRSIYAHPHQMVDRDRAAEELAAIFPDLDAGVLKKRFAPPSKFVWVRRAASPEQAQAVHDIGEPGLLIGRRQTRLYPNGHAAAHVLGASGFGREAVDAAEVVGLAGTEKWFDTRLRSGQLAGGQLELSIDLTAQITLRKVLSGGMKLMGANSGSAILMKADTGEIVAMTSLPDFDPNHPPAIDKSADPTISPFFNRAAQGLYELGSSYKIITAAIAMETGVAEPDTLIDTKPMQWGKYRIREFGNADFSPFLSLTQVIVKSSNIGSGRVALEFGAEKQKEMLDRLGFFDPTPLELPEAASADPILPPKWSDISTITVAYGHGLSATPVHLAAAYASLTNGGHLVRPTLVKVGDDYRQGPRVVSEKTSRRVRDMLRLVVTQGTAKMADVPGYEVGGKTGTAVKPKATGGYYDDKVIANFAAVFPSDDPKYVLIVMLDEPEDTVNGRPRRTAGWTAAPIAAEIIRRTAPVLGLAPDYRLASESPNR